jgi:hypothetical protein
VYVCVCVCLCVCVCDCVCVCVHREQGQPLRMLGEIQWYLGVLQGRQKEMVVVL